MLCFDLKEWPKEKVWTNIRECTRDRAIVAVPHKGKIVAFEILEEFFVISSDRP